MAASGRVFMMIHADAGIGKTSLIGQLARAGFKVLIMRSPIDHVDVILGSGAQEMIVKDRNEMTDALDYLRMEGKEWDWVFWDSATLTQDVMLDDVYQTMLARHGNPGTTKREERAQFGPDRGEYRTNMFFMEEFVRYCVGVAEFNFGIMAHSFWYTPYGADDEVGAEIWPLIQGKNMPQKISGAMNVVGYMEMKEVTVKGNTSIERVIHFNKSPRWYAKCAFKDPNGSDAFPNDLIAPTMPQIVERLAQCRLQSQGERRVGRSAPRTPNTGKPNTAPVRRATKKS